jgi:hypothetical protein
MDLQTSHRWDSVSVKEAAKARGRKAQGRKVKRPLVLSAKIGVFIYRPRCASYGGFNTCPELGSIEPPIGIATVNSRYIDGVQDINRPTELRSINLRALNILILTGNLAGGGICYRLVCNSLAMQPYPKLPGMQIISLQIFSPRCSCEKDHSTISRS